MATTHDYMDYLDDRVDIAPAGTEEELQAAEILESLFAQHGLDTQLQYFSTSVFAGLSEKLYMLLIFVGIILAGFVGMTALSLVGVLLVGIGLILLLLAREGKDPLLRIGPRTSSQNVIGVHHATGPNVVKGNRPIVVVAHYDTPQENYLFASELVSWQRLIKRMTWPLCIVVSVFAVAQLLLFVPTAVRHILWALGVLASIPLMVQSLAVIYERFSAATPGAVDNKSSVAALLGVVDKVRPADDTAKAWASGHPQPEHTGRIAMPAQEDGSSFETDKGEDSGISLDIGHIRDAVADATGMDTASVTSAMHGLRDRVSGFTGAIRVRAAQMIGRDVQTQQDLGDFVESVGEPIPRGTSRQHELEIEDLSTRRHGADKLRDMQILPDGCEISYVGIVERTQAEEDVERVRAAQEAVATALAEQRRAQESQMGGDTYPSDHDVWDGEILGSDVVDVDNIGELSAMQSTMGKVETIIQGWFAALLKALSFVVERVGGLFRTLVDMVNKNDLPVIDKADPYVDDAPEDEDDDMGSIVFPVEQIFPDDTDEESTDYGRSSVIDTVPDIQVEDVVDIDGTIAQMPVQEAPRMSTEYRHTGSGTRTPRGAVRTVAENVANAVASTMSTIEQGLPSVKPLEVLELSDESSRSTRTADMLDASDQLDVKRATAGMDEPSDANLSDEDEVLVVDAVPVAEEISVEEPLIIDVSPEEETAEDIEEPLDSAPQKQDDDAEDIYMMSDEDELGASQDGPDVVISTGDSTDVELVEDDEISPAIDPELQDAQELELPVEHETAFAVDAETTTQEELEPQEELETEFELEDDLVQESESESQPEVAYEAEPKFSYEPESVFAQEPEPDSAIESALDDETKPTTEPETAYELEQESEPEPEAVPGTELVFEQEMETESEEEEAQESAYVPEAESVSEQELVTEPEPLFEQEPERGLSTDDDFGSVETPSEYEQLKEESIVERHQPVRHPQPLSDLDEASGVPVEVVDVNALLVKGVYQSQGGKSSYGTTGRVPLDEPDDLYAQTGAATAASPDVWELEGPSADEVVPPVEPMAPAPLRDALDEMRFSNEQVTDAAYPYDPIADVASAFGEDLVSDEEALIDKSYEGAREAEIHVTVADEAATFVDQEEAVSAEEFAALDEPSSSTEQAATQPDGWIDELLKDEEDDTLDEEEPEQPRHMDLLEGLSKFFGGRHKSESQTKNKMATLLDAENEEFVQQDDESYDDVMHEPSEVPYDEVLAQARQNEIDERMPKAPTSYDVLAQAAREAVADIPQDEPSPDQDVASDLSYDRSFVEGLTFSSEMDVRDDWHHLDDAGMLTIPREALADAESVIAPIDGRRTMAQTVDDPEWGTTSFRPSFSGIARRARLLDLPDPSVIETSDQFGSYGMGNDMENGSYNQTSYGTDSRTNYSGSYDTGYSSGYDAGSGMGLDDSDRFGYAQPSPRQSMPATPNRRMTSNMSTSQRRELLSHVPSPLDEPQTPQNYVVRYPTGDLGPGLAARQVEQEAETPRPMHERRESEPTGKRGLWRRGKANNRRDDDESLSSWLGLDEDYDAHTSGRRIGDWDHFDDEEGRWKGGAALRAGLRGQQASDDEELPTQGDDEATESEVDDVVVDATDQEEVTPEVTEEPDSEQDDQQSDQASPDEPGLGDDELIAHDIWFVATGSSTRDHAGIRAFLDEHRHDIRGAFLVNLESVGAGQMSVLTQEGSGSKRRADRRMVRLLDDIASARDIDLDRVSMEWETTEATPAMQRFIRVATLMGISPEGVPALSHTLDDTIDAVHDAQVANVCEMVAELIRKA